MSEDSERVKRNKKKIETIFNENLLVKLKN